MSPWKVVGFEFTESESGEEGIRLFVERPAAGESMQGMETERHYYKPKYVKYDPHIGDLVVVVKGRYGIQEIIVINI